MVKSLEEYPLEWCTVDRDTAQTQLQGGDFHVYYSLDENGEAKVPRLAIRMEDSNIAEVRGIAPDQNLDPYISSVLEKKLEKFGPEGEKYKKKTKDMEYLTEVAEKSKADKELSKENLRFLYEIDSPIEGFGYQEDPRIAELRATRDPEVDMPIIFECERSNCQEYRSN